MPQLLFVCTANQFRSPLAAASFSRKLSEFAWKDKWHVQSAGTWAQAGLPALPAAAAIGQRLGLSLAGHRSQMITPALVSTQNLILTMEIGQKEALQAEFPLFEKRIFLLTEVALGQALEIADPVQGDDGSYFDVAQKLCALVERGFYRICGRALNTGLG